MIIGTAGHIDHGKTLLVRALTGVDTDRLKEEKTRGITIELGFAYLSDRNGASLGFVDVPGHEKFVHTMAAGASGVDFALLVVAANNGIMPQTREHLAILDLLGVTRGIVALTKIDLVDGARRDEVAADIRAAIVATGLHDAAVLAVSAVTGEGIGDLRDRLFAAARKTAQRSVDGLFRLAIDRSFVLHGAGTVVTGTALSGTVSEGDRLIVSPSGIAGRVRSIHAQNRPVTLASAGMRVALNIAGVAVSKDAVRRGDMILDPALHAPAHRIDARLKLLASETRNLAQWTPVRLHHGSADVAARISLLTDTGIAPGETRFIQLVLERPIAAAAHDRFVIRDVSGQRTMGGGAFVDLRAPRRKRRTPERVAQLEAHAFSDPRAAFAALLATAPFYVALTSFARDRALTGSQIDALSAELNLVRSETKDGLFAVAAPVWARFASDAEAMLGAFHAANPDLPGMSVEGLRLALTPRFPASPFPSLLSCAGQSIAIEGAWARLRSHTVRLTAQDEALWTEIAALLSGGARFRPPRVRDVAESLGIPEPNVRRLTKLASRLARADEVAHDHFFLRTTIAEMADIAIGLGGGANDAFFTAAQFRDRLENGRKVSIQILEFFDRHGVTIRRGDLRRISPNRKDLFRADSSSTTSAAQAAE